MIRINGYDLNDYFLFDELSHTGSPEIFMGEAKFHINVNRAESNIVITGYIKGSDFTDAEAQAKTLKENIFDTDNFVGIAINGYDYYGIPISFTVVDVKPNTKKVKIVYKLKTELHRLFPYIGESTMKFGFPVNDPKYEV